MTSVLDYKLVKKELLHHLRNSDVLTTTQRGVTTTTKTGTWAMPVFEDIAVTNVKNIRSITVESTPLTFGTDYTYETNYVSGSSVVCRITFNPLTTPTGDYVITYDYGTDKIYTDSPRDDLTISSFPRISINTIGDTSVENELSGATKLTTFTFSINIYAKDEDELDDYHKACYEAIISNQTGFYYLKYVRKINTGPTLPFGAGKQKVRMRSTDYGSWYNIETA